MHWHYMEVMAVTAILMLGSLEQPTIAQQVLPFAAEIQRDLASHLESGLPNIDELVSGYQPPASFSPSLMIGNFEIESLDGIPWGGVVGQILRWRIPFGPHLLARIPHPEPDRFRADINIPGLDPKQNGVSLESVSVVYPRLGIENALVGKGKITGSTFTLACELYSLPSRQLIKRFDFSGPLSNFTVALDQLTLPLLEAIGVQLDDVTRTYLTQHSTSSFEELRRYGQFINKSKENPTPDELLAEAVSIWKSGIQLAGFVPLYCYALSINSERLGEEINTHLKEILERFKGHSAVEAFVYRMWYTEKGETPSIDFYKAYQQLAKDNPLDLIPMIRFGDQALEPQHASYQGIVVALNNVENFPMNYRSWWSLSADLMTMASQLAEENQGGDLAERCQAYSEACLNRALALHPVSMELWQDKANRMAQQEGLSQKTFDLVAKAVECGQRNPQYIRFWYNQAAMGNYDGMDPYPLIRVAEIAARYLPDDPQSIQYFGWIENGFYKAKDKLDNTLLCQRVKETAQVGRLFLEHYPILSLTPFIRSGDLDLVGLFVQRQFDRWQKDPSQNEANLYDLSEVALCLGNADLAEKCLNTLTPENYEGIPNGEDYLAAMKALIPAMRGNPGETCKLLEARIAEAEDNLYSRFRYVELSLTHPVNSEIRAECLKYLIDYAPEEVAYSKEKNGFLPRNHMANDVPLFCQDALRWITKGHLASAEGKHQEAMEAFQNAFPAIIQIQHTSFLQSYITFHEWKERRVLAEATQGKSGE